MCVCIDGFGSSVDCELVQFLYNSMFHSIGDWRAAQEGRFVQHQQEVRASLFVTSLCVVMLSVYCSMTVRLTAEYVMLWRLYVVPFAIIVGLCVFVTLVFVVSLTFNCQPAGDVLWLYPFICLTVHQSCRTSQGFTSDSYQAFQKRLILTIIPLYTPTR